MLTQAELKNFVIYKPETGLFLWRHTFRAGRNKAFVITVAGARAGGVGTYGYRYLTINKAKRLPEHRLAFLYMLGAYPPKGHDVDHINMVVDDNRWCNLRLATRSENMQNIRLPHKDNQTGFLGVEVKREKYSARICINGKRLTLGSFDTPELAHDAYVKAKRKYHPRGSL